MRGWPASLFKAATKPDFTSQGYFLFSTFGSSRSGVQSIIIDGVLCGKSGIVTWGCHRLWDGRHSTSTNEPVWRGPVTVARGAVAFQVPVS